MSKILKTPATLPPPDERRRLRESVGLSGAALAAEIGVAPATVYGWESGREPRGLLRDAYAVALERLRAHTTHGETPDA